MGRHTIPVDRRARVCDCGDHGFVLLTKAAVAFFSPEDLPLAETFRWNLLTCGKGKRYARAIDGGQVVLMHVRIASPEPGLEVDHEDGDGLNNRRINLRPCTHANNIRSGRPRKKSASPFKGVHRSGGKWGFQVYRDGHCVRGRRETEIEAARAYDAAALHLHGKFALTNAMLGLLPDEAAA